MRPLRILTLAFLLFTLAAAAQTDRRIEEQKRVIAALEKRIATEEQEISKIQKGRTATEERVRRLARQIDSRNQLLDETEKQARLLREEIARTDSVAGNLSATLERDRAQYGEMVREAYRNYKHNNYLTYIFSSRDFTDVARKITALREVASLRERKLRDIEALTAEVRTRKGGARPPQAVARFGDAQPLGAARETPARRPQRQGQHPVDVAEGEDGPCSAKSHRNSSWTWPSANCAS